MNDADERVVRMPDDEAKRRRREAAERKRAQNAAEARARAARVERIRHAIEANPMMQGETLVTVGLAMGRVLESLERRDPPIRKSAVLVKAGLATPEDSTRHLPRWMIRSGLEPEAVKKRANGLTKHATKYVEFERRRGILFAAAELSKAEGQSTDERLGELLIEVFAGTRFDPHGFAPAADAQGDGHDSVLLDIALSLDDVAARLSKRFDLPRFFAEVEARKLFVDDSQSSDDATHYATNLDRQPLRIERADRFIWEEDLDVGSGDWRKAPPPRITVPAGWLILGSTQGVLGREADIDRLIALRGQNDPAAFEQYVASLRFGAIVLAAVELSIGLECVEAAGHVRPVLLLSPVTWVRPAKAIVLAKTGPSDEDNWPAGLIRFVGRGIPRDIDADATIEFEYLASFWVSLAESRSAADEQAMDLWPAKTCDWSDDKAPNRDVRCEPATPGSLRRWLTLSSVHDHEGGHSEYAEEHRRRVAPYPGMDGADPLDPVRCPEGTGAAMLERWLFHAPAERNLEAALAAACERRIASLARYFEEADRIRAEGVARLTTAAAADPVEASPDRDPPGAVPSADGPAGT